MVGWSRHNAESSARRRRWWASLTEEQRRVALELEEAFDRKVTRWGLVFVGLVLLALGIGSALGHSR